jgi:dihydroceramidase
MRLITRAQLVREIESQAIAAQQQISTVRAQMASKQREARLIQLTRSEVGSLPPETSVYEGVGKMSVFTPSLSLRLQVKLTDLAVRLGLSPCRCRPCRTS